MKKKETKEFRVLGRMLAEELPKEALEQARGAKISSYVGGGGDIPDFGG